MTKEKLAYLAGWMDGEGTFTMIKFKKRDYRAKGNPVRGTPAYQSLVLCKVAAKPEQVEVLEEIKKHFGGTIKLFQPKSTARYSNKNYSAMCQYRAASAIAGELTKALFPYLRVKREVAEVILKHQEIINTRRKKYGTKKSLLKEELEERENLLQQTRILNQRGKATLND